MTRRSWLWVVVFCGACGRSAPPPDLFPPVVASVWHRTALQEMSASDAPEPVPRNTIDHLLTASYEGPGKLDARVYQLESAAMALDVAQRWRPSSDTVFFYRDRFFVVVKWQEADRNALKAFVAELEKRLGKPTEPR